MFKLIESHPNNSGTIKKKKHSSIHHHYHLPGMPPPQTLLEGLKDYGHEDTFAPCDELSPDKHGLLIKELEIIFLPFL